jgi:hypothetical protein
MTKGVYQTLTPASELRSLGIGNLSFNAAQPVSFAGTMSFIANIFFITALVTAVGFAIYAQSKVIVGGEKNLKEAKEINGHVIWGLILMFSMFVLIATFNKDLLLADFNLTAIKARRGAVTIPNTATTPATGGGAVTSASCESTSNTISSIRSGDVCGNTRCSALSGCNYQQYLPFIRSAVSAQGLGNDAVNAAIVIMCRESHADNSPRNTQRAEGGGSYSCGLMQVNQATPCDANSLDPQKSIMAGVAKLKEKMSSAQGKVYAGVPSIANVFASYNCCSRTSGTVASATSVDCTREAGFPDEVPKWACPINPGSSNFNMCAVKNYACDLSACFKTLSN